MISSRTPEGDPNECPVCRQTLAIEPSRPPGDAPCPHCGQLLWFDEQNGPPPRQAAARALALLAAQLNVPVKQLLADARNDPRLLEKLAADSLDTVELVMEFEEEFDR